ncbi:hypothetical protein BAP_2999 [Bacillus sp. CN2]|nr:hypothetical protein BAP_2999 [Bacillus sp. CN2]
MFLLLKKWRHIAKNLSSFFSYSSCTAKDYARRKVCINFA